MVRVLPLPVPQPLFGDESGVRYWESTKLGERNTLGTRRELSQPGR